MKPKITYNSITKRSHRTIALFFVCVFMQTLIPYNRLWANNNGPTSPEASSFEPVDATDMVSLATGDLSYVLPLLNVPSPEGGYPISLAYHAGITLDQEATWSGLGWNVNPGAINRSVNGFPDDWKNARYKSYFYDKGEEVSTYSVSLGISAAGAGPSVGLSLSWGDNQAFGGSVSYGIGVEGVGSFGATIGTNGVSINGGVGIGDTPLSIGGSIGTNGVSLGANFGFDDGKNSGGKSYNQQGISLSVSSSWSGDVSANVTYSQGETGKKNSIGLNMSSSGVGVSGKIGGAGVGASFFSRAISSSDYNVRQSGYHIPVFIPIPGAIINFSFGKSTVKINADKLEDHVVNGTLYYKDNYELFNSESNWFNRTIIGDLRAKLNPISDIYEVNLNSNASINLSESNGAFPNYDNYRVTGQGIAGSMVPRHRKNGALFGVNAEVRQKYSNYDVTYELPSSSTGKTAVTKFYSVPEFQFQNDYTESSYMDIIGKSNIDLDFSNIFSYISTDKAESVSLRRGSRYVEHFTNKQMDDRTAYDSGLLAAPSGSQVFYGSYDPDGIGAFKITSPDGKTYHYTIPVYNHEVVSRSFGFSKFHPEEDNAFSEKRQLESYATHWLLTAITGPDYVDTNSNNRLDKEDYGYWVGFDYGKWSNGYIWYGPHGKDYEESGVDNKTKSYYWGRKDIYYLDKVFTRTHTALFVKEERSDSRGKQLVYKTRKNRFESPRTFNLKEQTLLKLKEILLLKNQDLEPISKVNATNLNSSPSANTNYTISWFDDPQDGGGTKNIRYSRQNQVLDSKDNNNWDALKTKSLKIVSFKYDYSLATKSPYTTKNGRLSLKEIAFKGKSGVQLQPAYKFEYKTGDYVLSNKDEWGYDKSNPDLWSLSEIKMPTGASIKINYEPDTFISAINQQFTFSTTKVVDRIFSVSSEVDFSNFGIEIGDQIPVSHRRVLSCQDRKEPSEPIEYELESYDGLATVLRFIDSKRIELRLNGEPKVAVSKGYGSDCFSTANANRYTRVSMADQFFSSGVRVKTLTTSDGTKNFRTEYNYNYPGTGNTSGIVSYIPFAPFADKEVPYGMELPPPIPMYGHVKTTSYGADNNSLGYSKYKFKTLPKKGSGDNSFGDIIQMSVSRKQSTNNAVNADIIFSEAEVKDNTACLGQLLSTASYNSQGQLLVKTVNEYAPIDGSPQGVIREAHQYYKITDHKNTIRDKWQVASSIKTVYASSLLSSTTTQGGFESTTYFDKYDKYSGQLLETRTELANGNILRNETVPAYNIYLAMGSRMKNKLNKHMLTQEAVKKTYVKDSTGWKLVNANINTWKGFPYKTRNNSTVDIWRKYKTYQWDGALGLYGHYTGFEGKFDKFNFQDPEANQPSQWKKISQINLYDPYSMILEVEDINGNKIATKMCDKETKIGMTGNAGYNDMYYSGAEHLDGNLLDNGISATGRTSERAHTGKYSIKIDKEQGFTTKLTKQKAGDYKISVWVSKDRHTGARIYDGDNLTTFNGEKVIAGDWVLLNHYHKMTDKDRTIYVKSTLGDTFFDDFRIHPVYASVKSYVYNSWDELSVILDHNNLGTKFLYDPLGSLCSTFVEVPNQDDLDGGFKLISKNRIGYKDGAVSSCQSVSGKISSALTSSTVDCNIKFNIQSFGEVKKWTVKFGDGNNQSGMGVPPDDITHKYASTGTKRPILEVFGEAGTMQSATTSINIVEKIRIADLIVENSGSRKSFKIYGVPGQPVNYTGSAGGSTSSIVGYISVNGTGRELNSGQQTVSGSAGTFPSNGYVKASLSYNNPNGGTGSVTLSVSSTGGCNKVSESLRFDSGGPF